MAIGDRAQAARTYLERHLDTFKTCNLDQLLCHAVEALRSTVHSTHEFTEKNCSITVLGRDSQKNLNEEEIRATIDLLPERQVTVAAVQNE